MAQFGSGALVLRLGQDAESLGEVAQFWPWPQARELEQVAGDIAGDPVRAGLLGSDVLGFLEVVQGFADLAAHGVRGCQVDEIARPALGRVGGGIVFRQRKGKSGLTLQCPPALLELLRENRKGKPRSGCVQATRGRTTT